MNQQMVKMAARIVAIEYMLGELFRTIYRLYGVSPEQIQQQHDELMQFVKGMSLPDRDPEVSNQLSGELEEAFRDLLRRIEDHVHADEGA
jgi:hypothetical protein